MAGWGGGWEGLELAEGGGNKQARIFPKFGLSSRGHCFLALMNNSLKPEEFHWICREGFKLEIGRTAPDQATR